MQLELLEDWPMFWDHTPWQQPWTVQGNQAWSLHAFAMNFDPMYMVDWPEGYYNFRAKITMWQGNTSTSYYSDYVTVAVFYD